MNAVVSTITRKSIFKTSSKEEQYQFRHGIILFFLKRIYILIDKNYMYVYIIPQHDKCRNQEFQIVRLITVFPE